MPDRPELAVLREKLGDYLQESIAVVVEDAGDFTIPHDSALVRVRAIPWTRGRTVARVWSVTNVGVRIDGDLTSLLLTANGQILFGGFRLDESVPAVLLVHSLLGEYVNRGELEAAVAAVAVEAASYGPALKEQFGGRLATDP